MHARTPSLGRHPGRLTVAVAVAGAAIGLGLPGGTAPGDAADRFVAGGPVAERGPVPAERAPSVIATAAAFRSRLGLAEPAAVRVDRVTDRFDGTAYDEVTATDRAGRALHLERFDDRGRLVGAVSFGWQAAGGRPLGDAAAAQSRARRLAADLDLGAAGEPDVRRGPDDSGWTIAWPRALDGVPVIGDGVRIDLWPDGRVHAVVRAEHQLAPRPATILAETAARTHTTAALGSIFGNRSDQVTISALTLAWVAPNDTFDPAAPDAPGPTLRLAWVAEARATGDLAEGLRAVKLFLDAGTGALNGGDVLR